LKDRISSVDRDCCTLDENNSLNRWNLLTELSSGNGEEVECLPAENGEEYDFVADDRRKNCWRIQE
jgi:hypothetical protein